MVIPTQPVQTTINCLNMARRSIAYRCDNLVKLQRRKYSPARHRIIERLLAEYDSILAVQTSQERDMTLSNSSNRR